MGTHIRNIIELDARRLLCPMPVIRLQDCIAKQDSNALIRITCTDPGTLQDIPTWCRLNGHRILETEQSEREYSFLVHKSVDSMPNS